MRLDPARKLIDALLDPSVEHAQYVPPEAENFGVVVGNFARGQAHDGGYKVWTLWDGAIGTFATGQRDPNKTIAVIR